MEIQSTFACYPIETLRGLLFTAVDRYGAKPALAAKRPGAYESISYLELRSQVECAAEFLLNLDLKKGDRIGIISENRPEWAIAYLAAVASGLTVVPIDKELKEPEIRHILNFSETRVVFAARDFLRMVTEEGSHLPMLSTVIGMDGDGGGAHFSFEDILAEGRSRLAEGDHLFAEVDVKPADTAVLIFTSGTTGAAKGVILSHGAVASNIMGTSFHVAIDRQDVLLSVLPLHHTYESTAGFLTALYQGALICYAESLRRVVDNLRESGATVMLGVPALFEAMYRRILAGIEEKGAGRFRLAKGIAGIGEKFFGVSLRRRLFRELHERFGGRLRLLISGGAAINPDVSRGFRELGIDFIQGYGMTEYGPIISVNRVGRFKDGSAGIPLPNTEVRIVNDEIVVRGPCLFEGYFRNDPATRETLRDGWLYTGDLGYLDDDGFLFVSGRRKSVIVTPNGKNVYPEEIESTLNESNFIQEALVWGGADENPSLTEVQAIIVPDFEAFDQKFGTDGWDDEKIMAVLSEEVRNCNRNLAGFKRIKKFVVRNEEFEKTTTRKIKRYLYTAKSKPLEKTR